MANNATIIAASLSDDELKNSIDKLVKHVENGTQKMKTSFNNAIEEMKRSLQSLGSVGKVGAFGADDGSARRTAAKRKETEASKEYILTLDQEAAARQRAAKQPSTAQESYYTFVKNMRENVALLAMEIKNMPSASLDRQFAAYMQFERQIEQTRNRITELRQELNKVGADPNGSRLVVKQIVEEITAQQQRLVQLEREQVQVTNQIAASDNKLLAQKKAMYEQEKAALINMSVGQREQAAAAKENATATQKQANAQIDIAKITKQTIEAESERRAALIRTGQAAQETANKITKSMYEQLSAEGNSPIMGIKQLNDLVMQMRTAFFSMSESERVSPIGKALEEDIKRAEKAITVVSKYNKSMLGLQSGSSNVLSNQSSLRSMRESIKNLSDEYNKLTVAEIKAGKGDRIIQKYQKLTRAAQILQKTLERPISFADAMKGDERTLDEIAYKLQRLQSYKRGINLLDPKQSAEIKEVDKEINRLQEDLNKYTATTKQATKANTALERSWNYMKNRLAFYFTVGASTQFIKNLIQVRSEYEMNEKALGILINSAERGSQIFSELSQMALVSPYTLIELSAAAKQLTAYDIAAKDVVDTTRRLADMSSAVGIPIERLTYALGQIKAYGYLNSRDARMFANAGIPLVKQLSDYYTELEGKLVSTADVYDRIKKKAIGYNDVMQVVYKMTDEGGKFFDFQAKMADTLKVRLANLTLAWNNMLNDIGKSEQGILAWTIGALRDLFKHWKEFDHAIKSVSTIAGLIVGLRTLSFVVNRLAIHFGASVEKMAVAEIAGKRFGNVLKTLWASFASVLKSPVTWIGLATMAIWEMSQALFGANKAQQELNRSIRDGAKDNFDNITKFLEQYQGLRESLYKTETQDGKEVKVAQDIDKEEAGKAWEAIREQIELTTKSSDEYISRLLQIGNVSERVRQGFEALDNIQVVSAALKEIDEDTIKVSKDISGWWNVWMLPKGLIGNLKEYQKTLNLVTENWGDVKTAAEQGGDAAAEDLSNLSTNLNRFNNDVKKTTDSIIEFINLKGWSGDVNKINEAFSQITNKIVIENQLSPQQAFSLQLAVEDARSEAARQALEERIAFERRELAIAYNDEIARNLQMHEEELKNFDNFNGKSRVYWQDFTKWMKEQHLSDMSAMFRGMDAEQIKSLDFQKGKYFEWVNNLVKKYSKDHHLAYSNVFNTLKNWIKNANTWSIFIPLTISTEDNKSIYEMLSDADTAADTAWKKIERLNKRKKELEEKNAKGSLTKKERKESIQLLDELAVAQKDYNDAIEKGGHSQKEDAKNKKEDAANKRKAAKAQKQAESELQKALREELQLIDDVRAKYKTLTKEGVDSQSAIKTATSGFGESVRFINGVFQKYGLEEFDLTKFAGISNPREVMDSLQAQLDKLTKMSIAKPEEIKDLEVKLRNLKVESLTFDYKTIRDSLNNELGKIKDEYELAIELDANPELGDMFEDMFGINRNDLPTSFGEAFDKANAIAIDKLRQLKVDTKDFDLMSSVIKPNEDNKWKGLDFGSDLVQDIVKWQNTFRDMFKKNISDTEKMLDDYVKKYGDYSDKVAEIEADRLERIKRLNEAYYNEEMRKRPEYARKLTAIEQGAQREKGQAKFDEFKNTRLYIAMFENLEYASTTTLNAVRQKLSELKNEMGSLSPEQLKQVMEQYEKIDSELTRRNPFKSLISNAKDYAKAIGKEGKEAQKDFVAAQRKYDWQLKIVAAKKEEYEQAKQQAPWNSEAIDALAKQLGIEEEKLAKLKEELGLAEAAYTKYDLMKKVFKKQATEVAALMQTIAANLQSLGELRDSLHDLFGVSLGAELDAVIDDLNQVGEGISKIVSSAQGGDFVGVAVGGIKAIAGIGDAIASIFGGGAAKTKKLNKQIDKSKESVWQLNLAYKNLERAIEKSLGSAETAARRTAIANKEAELSEIEKQLVLEQKKRSKDRDNDTIKEYQEKIQDLRYEIEDLQKELVSNLLGNDIKSAAEDFVDTWVDAWRAGETTLDAINEKMNDMVYNLIKKAVASTLVEKLLQPLYNAVDQYTMESSAGGVDLTREEIKALAAMSRDLGIDINETLGAFYSNLESMGAISRTIEDGGGNLSALQQGIQGITEETAGALEAYMNIVSQQVFLHSDLLTQIRDLIVGLNIDVQTASLGQILLQLQASYQAQMAIQNILTGALNPSGSGFKVELIN